MAKQSESALALKALRERAGLTVRDVARELGKSPSGYAFYENDYKRPYLPAELTKPMAELLAGLGEPPITNDEVMALSGLVTPDGAEERARKRRRPQPEVPEGLAGVPELDIRAGAGGVQLSEAMIDDPGSRLWQLPAPMLQAQTTAPMGALRIISVFGDSMEPEFPPGTKVLVDTSDTVPTPPGVFVVFDGLGLALKRVQHIAFSEPPTVRISSDNTRYDSYERAIGEAHLQGRVIGLWKWK
ncbi:phage repressor protein C with HTH and peptisase S24 domain [Stella humosa]|uniref:Phage repressor protein C with HTH and peptisase S24 domain n=1 Tax=Stella humosa TaxID=94 RepID=A0A3N1M9W2_9PROT|nr:LexA family transcriptional regulator [Stella humosa]ROQ00473.1 phage repressor protein C with HTH and peptisase S24 domain [Stella humosa]